MHTYIRNVNTVTPYMSFLQNILYIFKLYLTVKLYHVHIHTNPLKPVVVPGDRRRLLRMISRTMVRDERMRNLGFLILFKDTMPLLALSLN